MLLQFTCSGTSQLSSILCAAVVVVSLSHVPSSVSLLTKFSITTPRCAVREPNVEFSWLDVRRILSDVSQLPVSTDVYPRRSFAVEITFSGIEGLKSSRFSLILMQPISTEVPSQIQLFGSKKYTPRGFATRQYLSFPAPKPRHVTSLRRKPLLRTRLQRGNLF